MHSCEHRTLSCRCSIHTYPHSTTWLFLVKPRVVVFWDRSWPTPFSVLMQLSSFATPPRSLHYHFNRPISSKYNWPVGFYEKVKLHMSRGAQHSTNVCSGEFSKHWKGVQEGFPPKGVPEILKLNWITWKIFTAIFFLFRPQKSRFVQTKQSFHFYFISLHGECVLLLLYATNCTCGLMCRAYKILRELRIWWAETFF